MDLPDPLSTVKGLEDFASRGAGSDAERRAANWLAAHGDTAGQEVSIETFWCRPNWAFAHLWHAAIALAGSLLTLASPIAGIVLLAIALASVMADAFTGFSLGRRLTPERASQNVVIARPSRSESPQPATRLLLTANYDAGRIGLAYRLRPATSKLKGALNGAPPGWLGWFALAIAWLLATAILREAGHKSQLVGALQFLPTVGVLIAFALLLELASGSWSPAAGDSAGAVAVVLVLATSLAEAPPRNLDVQVVLTGAGDGEQIGLRRYLKTHKDRRRRTSNTIVLGVAPCGGGTPHWWQSDGPFLPLRFGATLRRIAQQVAAGEPHLTARPHRGRGTSAAFPARVAGLPALTIGCLDDNGLVPRSHNKTDVAANLDRQAIERAVQFGLLIIDGIDAAVAQAEPRPAPTRA